MSTLCTATAPGPTSEDIAFKPLVAEREEHQPGKKVAWTLPVGHYWDS